MLTLAIPIAMQQFIASLLNMLDVLMVGQLGEASIAALGLSNQVFFLLNLMLFGLSSGMAIFTAQYWGMRDLPNIRRVLGICLSISISVATLFMIAAVVFPSKILAIYTSDQEVVRIGSNYLRIAGLSYIPTATTFAFVAILRSTQQVRMPMVVTMIALSFKTVLAYGLIFGKAGLPVLGVQGAAIGTTIARILELSMLLFLIYKYRTPAAARLSELFSFGAEFFKRVLRTAMPAMANEIIWSLGITVYNAVYAHIGTDSIAAVNINGTFENIAFVTFLGIGHSCAIMVGNEIGAGNRKRAQEIGGVFLFYGLAGAVLMGMLYKLVTPQLLHLYNISDISANLARQIIAIYSLSLWVRATNFMLFIGILRAGGDTHFALKVESFTIWFVGVPAALIGGFVLHLPVYGVYAMVLAEEVVKALVVIPRYRSRAWIHDLVNVAA